MVGSASESDYSVRKVFYWNSLVCSRCEAALMDLKSLTTLLKHKMICPGEQVIVRAWPFQVACSARRLGISVLVLHCYKLWLGLLACLGREGKGKAEVLMIPVEF